MLRQTAVFGTLDCKCQRSPGREYVPKCSVQP